MAKLQVWAPWLAEAGTLLDQAELDRVTRKRRLVDQQALLLSYALHRLFLGAWMGIDPADVPIGRDEQGRPEVRGTQLSTSLSHAEHAVAFAACLQGAVGVDIEGGHRASTLEDIAGRICHPAELHAVDALPAQARHAALLQLWVRKEAYLKAVGVGLAWDMDGFAAPAGACLPLHPERAGSVVLSAIDLDPDHVIAVAAPVDAELVAFPLDPVRPMPAPVPCSRGFR